MATEYVIREAEDRYALQSAMNLLASEGYTVVWPPIQHGLSFLIAGTRSEHDRHEFRPRGNNDDICALCHYEESAPFHIKWKNPGKHDYRQVEGADWSYIPCAVCGQFPEHPLHGA